MLALLAPAKEQLPKLPSLEKQACTASFYALFCHEGPRGLDTEVEEQTHA